MKYEWSDKIGNRSLQQLASAAEPYLADQATASDPRCGLVQPITVAEAEALAIALQQAWQVLQRSTAGTRLERRRVPGTARRPARAGRTASRQDGMSVTVPQAAARLGVSPGRVRQLIADGRLRARKLGRDWLIHARALAAVAHRNPGRPVTTGAGLRRRDRTTGRKRSRQATRGIGDEGRTGTGAGPGPP